MKTLNRILRTARAFGPYLLVELLLPGGTLIALFMWITQGAARTSLSPVVMPPAPRPTLEHSIAIPKSAAHPGFVLQLSA